MSEDTSALCCFKDQVLLSTNCCQARLSLPFLIKTLCKYSYADIERLNYTDHFSNFAFAYPTLILDRSGAVNIKIEKLTRINHRILDICFVTYDTMNLSSFPTQIFSSILRQVVFLPKGLDVRQPNRISLRMSCSLWL